MTTRVEEERAQQRYDEQKRIEKELRAKNTQNADQFKKVVAAKQDTGARVQRRQEANGNMTKQQQSSGKRGQAQRALLARSGIQSRDLQAELMKRSTQSAEQHHADAKDHAIDVNEKAHTEHEHQLTQRADGEKRVQQQNDRLTAIAHDDQHHGSEQEAADGGGMGGGQMGMPMQKNSTTGSSEAKGSAGGARIPQNALNAIVKMCAIKINPKGLAEFQIELRDDVLGGSKLNISANGRKINATFVSDDANVRRLLKASEQDLARAFDEGGLTLESFRVSAF